jgi:pyruvate-ferredoxin/flavodoxin oxidoreductase
MPLAEHKMVTIDGNEAAAYVAHKTNEVIAIYPITPSSPMGELSDEWSDQGARNIWGQVPRVVEMQSEGGAAGAVHGSLQAGALTTTFTASQGLLLMIPNMYKIAGELTPAVIHVAARSLAAQALSIFGDHSDVMATRSTGFAMLASGSVQEVLDLALVAQAATLAGRIPFLHFFDGFRTSHEVAKIAMFGEDTIRAMVSDELVARHRRLALSPDHPVIRGTSQNPDVYFQARETVNPYYEALPGVVQRAMDQLEALTGRSYRLFDYHGHPQAERVMILMGSGAEAVEETVDYLLAGGEKVGLIRVRLYRPFSVAHLIAALPASVKAIAAMDRTKEPGADGEPLYKDVVASLVEHVAEGGGKLAAMPKVVGGRYGLSSKEFTPDMIRAVFANLAQDRPKNHFTIGIHDDVTHTSLDWQRSPEERYRSPQPMTRCMFYGLGADGTVSANKNTIKIVGEETDLYAQGYFVYDSKKSGAVTVSHLRFSRQPIRSTYLIGADEADFIGCHQTVLLDRYPMLDHAAPGATFLINASTRPELVWHTLPKSMQEAIIAKEIRLYVIDGYEVARLTGMGRRINTIMQTCFFAISGVLPQAEAIGKIKQAVKKTYARKGEAVIDKNFAAIDTTLNNLYRVEVPGVATSARGMRQPVADGAPDFVRQVTARIIAGHGDDLPVSAMPADGTYPTGTARYEKRAIAPEIPVWDEALCIACGKCPFVCPHAAIRSKVFPEAEAASAPATFKHMAVKGAELEGMRISYQVAPEDCTGCGLCVDVCPARDKANPEHKALMLHPINERLDQERRNWDYFLSLPEFDRGHIRWGTMKSAMLAEPLFEFSGACVGCGETPYIRLATQLFGDRMLIANATGCSSIYGGNLPTTPFSRNLQGRGPAWSNSLFEDNAEFGLGFRLAIDQHRAQAEQLLKALASDLGDDLVGAMIAAPQSSEPEIFEQRKRIEAVRARLKEIDKVEARRLEVLVDYLAKKSVWIIGGDGWAYDIGFGGLDHVMAQGRDVNILILDTEVYSNTGGQTSKATPKGAVAKFSVGGKETAKKDLGLIAMAYENVYVASVASGAKDVHTLKVFMEAESYPGTSVIIAYSPCIAHGVDLGMSLRQQELAVRCGHWLLYRYDPRRRAQGLNPLVVDSKRPELPLRDYYETETRFSVLFRTHPEAAERLLEERQKFILHRYEHMVSLAAAGLEQRA